MAWKLIKHNKAIIIIMLILSGCSGGLSGIMSSSGVNYWQIYRISYDPAYVSKLDKPFENILEDIFYKLWFEKKHDWGKPILRDAQVATFQRRYKDRYISLDVQISPKHIIIMSSSYSSYTKELFDDLKSVLNETFGEYNVEECYGAKDLNGHSCFEDKWG